MCTPCCTGAIQLCERLCLLLFPLLSSFLDRLLPEDFGRSRVSLRFLWRGELPLSTDRLRRLWRLRPLSRLLRSSSASLPLLLPSPEARL